MKILIVDDHAVIHQGLKRTLEDEFKGAIFGDGRDSKQHLSSLAASAGTL